MAITKIAAVLLVVGLVVGVVAGYGVGFIIYQPQISQLQSDLSKTQSSLSETQSALSKSQSEVESLRKQLTEAKDKITATEAELTKARTNITVLETKLSESETKYATLSLDYKKFKSDITSAVNSLKKKIKLAEQIIEVEIYVFRHDWKYPETMTADLKPYVDAVGDSSLSSYFGRMEYYWEPWNSEGFHLNYADLMERLIVLIETDLSKLDTIIAS